MNAKDALASSLKSARHVTEMVLQDLQDADLLVRPVPGSNHIAWQLGHLIASENQIGEMIQANSMPPLPAEFKERHSRQSVSHDNASDFCSKQEYLQQFQAQRDATLRLLGSLPEGELDRASPEAVRSYAPTIGDMFVLIANHELMHVGQYTTVRRKLGKPVVF